MRHQQRTIALVVALLAAGFAATPAFASAIVGRNVTGATLAIDSQGRAHVGYSAEGRRVALVAWGAINARTPSRTRPQVEFRIRYGDGGGGGVCLPYDGPPLPWLVKACKAPDGSYWALQSWARLEPNYGGDRGVRELHLSHWRGPLAQLVVYQNWTHRTIRHIFGRLTYLGRGVHGFSSTAAGDPLDGYGRNIYIDTFDSRYGRGWHRANSALTHRRGHTLGDFCFAFYPHAGHPSGDGARYRATVEGPGVTPDVMWEASDIGPLNPTVQEQMRSLERSWGDPKCRA
jgi:hypothetical protein